VALRQVEGELHRVLAGGPLAGVVQPHEQEHRLAVALLDLGADLDPADGAPLERPVRERQGLDQARMGGREPVEVGVVVRGRAVARAAARQRGPLDGLRPGGAQLVAARPGDAEIGDLDLVREAGSGQSGGVLVAVEHDLDVVVAAVLGQVESETEQQVPVGRCGGRDPDQRRDVRGRRVLGVSGSSGQGRRGDGHGQAECGGGAVRATAPTWARSREVLPVHGQSSPVRTSRDGPGWGRATTGRVGPARVRGECAARSPL
jgi:hypothetical protein